MERHIHHTLGSPLLYSFTRAEPGHLNGAFWQQRQVQPSLSGLLLHSSTRGQGHRLLDGALLHSLKGAQPSHGFHDTLHALSIRRLLAGQRVDTNRCVGSRSWICFLQRPDRTSQAARSKRGVISEKKKHAFQDAIFWPCCAKRWDCLASWTNMTVFEMDTEGFSLRELPSQSLRLESVLRPVAASSTFWPLCSAGYLSQQWKSVSFSSLHNWHMKYRSASLIQDGLLALALFTFWAPVSLCLFMSFLCKKSCFF